MRIRSTLSPTNWKILLILGLFAAAGTIHYRNAQADDLASSYVGCRVLSVGEPDHLFAYDPNDFAAVGPDDPWQEQADAGGFEAFLHPYVQTPLWAFSLQPLCSHTSFRTFERVFALCTMLSFAAFLWLIARFWAPTLARPLPIALLCLLLALSVPFRYAMMLMQTHILLMLLTIASLILAERGRWLLAGLLLALAAAVKLTPAVFLLYWLLTRRWKAAASLAAWSAALFAITLLTTGPHLMQVYLADLHRISNILLLSQNNQSFAAWWMGHLYPPGEVSQFHNLPLPNPVRLASTALMVLFTAAGGLIDRQSATQRHQTTHLGAVMGLLAATLFAPIAWTHYFVILFAPLMILLHENRENPGRQTVPIYAVIAFIALLNVPPLATDVESMEIGPYSILRGQFFAGVLSIVALGVLAWRRRSIQNQSLQLVEQATRTHRDAAIQVASTRKTA